MNKKHSLILALVLTLLIANIVYVFSLTQSEKREKVIITQIIDGDTLILENGERVRLLNINTPEKGTPGFEQSILFISNLINKSVEFEETGLDKYGRTLGRIFAPDYLNLQLVKKGLATKFLVEESEINDFAQSEKLAIDNSRGIWLHSQFFGCLESTIDAEEEKVFIKDKCNIQSVKDWVLKDESRKEYKLKDIRLDEITINTKEGIDNETDLFWRSSQSIWNNDRDTLYIFDSERKIVHYNFYGY